MKPNRKVKKPCSSSKQLILEEIIGLTTRNCNGLASSTSAAKCAYVAGCVVVVYDVDSSTQSHLMVSHRTPKPLTCVAMSHDGRFIAAGEAGPQPVVLVWDCVNLAFISELKGHLYGVDCIAFSPDGEHLVSVGGYIYLWNWRSGMLVTKLKANSSCSAITSVSFSLDTKFIVTAGKKHLKFWTIGSSPRTRLNRGMESLTMHAKPVNLGIQKGSSFVSVISASWTDSSVVNDEQTGEIFDIYALTDAGILYIVHSGLSVTKSMDLKVEKGFALSASDKLIACACSNGAVQLFTIQTLKYVGTLHSSKAKMCNGENNTVCDAKATGLDFQLAPTLPDAIACQFSTSEKLVVVYGDHSLYIWHIHDVNEATRCCMLVSHSGCIWDIKNLCCENMHYPSLACVARGCSGGVSFSTCSTDGTIRLWDLSLQHDLSKDELGHGSLNIDPESTAHLVSAGIFERGTMETSISTQGIRSMAVSSDGKYLAAGDFEGNLHIYDLKSSDYTYFKDAHDAEILSLSFSLSSKKDDISEVMDSHYFLASGGRDRTIHLYDVKRNFDLVESIDDHSAAVTSVKFTCNGHKILSCSADRSLVFRDVAATGSAYKILRRHHQLASHGTVYDMDIDPTMEVVITVGQDKKINSFNIAAGKLIRSFKQDKDFGDPIKVTMDPSGSYLVCSYSNKSICLYDFISGEMITQAMGHGEVITGVTFLPDCKHIVSVGGDGCIFVWKVPVHLASRMVQKVRENYGILSPRNLVSPLAFNQILICEEEDQKCRMDQRLTSLDFDQFRQGLHYQHGKPRVTSAFKFSISRLPKWAQKRVTSSDIVSMNLDFSSSQQVEPKILSPLVGDGEGYASVGHKVQNPSNHDVGDCNSCLSTCSTSSSDATISRSSPLPQEAISYALDKRWLTVYTVCMDLMNSPEVQSFKDAKIPLSFPSLSQGPLKILSDGEGSSWHGGHAQVAATSKYANSNNTDFLGKNNNQLDMKNLSACNENIAHAAEQSYSEKNEVQENIDVNTCHIKSDNSDLFKQHFGSLSTTNMAEKRKSTVRRRFSLQYVVRRDSSGDSKRLFDTPIQNFDCDTLNCGEESASHAKSEDQAFPMINSCKQDLKNLTQSLLSQNPALCQDEITKCPVKENSMYSELEEATNHDKCVPERNEVLERINKCKEALVNLDAAAENVVQLFSKLGSLVSREELSSGHGSQLYDEAADLLPSIAEKVNTVAKMARHRNNDLSGRSGIEVSRFEPLIGTFAESLSQKVVEILKNNLSDI